MLRKINPYDNFIFRVIKNLKQVTPTKILWPKYLYKPNKPNKFWSLLWWRTTSPQSILQKICMKLFSEIKTSKKQFYHFWDHQISDAMTVAILLSNYHLETLMGEFKEMQFKKVWKWRKVLTNCSFQILCLIKNPTQVRQLIISFPENCEHKVIDSPLDVEE